MPKLSKVAVLTGAASGGGTHRRRVTVGTDRYYQQRGDSGHLDQTGNDLQEEPTTRDSEPLNRIWDHALNIGPSYARKKAAFREPGHTQEEYAMQREKRESSRKPTQPGHPSVGSSLAD